MIPGHSVNKKLRIFLQAICMIITSTLVCAAPLSDHQTGLSTHSDSKPIQKAQIWNLKNADIRAVIQTVSMVTGKNFIVDPRVNGKVTLISHKPMSPDEIYQVFLSLLRVLNFSAVPGENSIKIIPTVDIRGYNTPFINKKHPAKGDEIVVKIVQVHNLSATALVSVLRPFLQNWGVIEAYTPTNSLILTDTAANIVRLTRIIKNMKNHHTQHTNVIKLKYSNAKKLAATLQSLQTSQQSKGQASSLALVADKENNSLLISGSLSDLLAMKNLIKILDAPGKSDDKSTVVFHLNYLDSKKLAPLLVNMIEGRSANAASSDASDSDDSDDDDDSGGSGGSGGQGSGGAVISTSGGSAGGNGADASTGGGGTTKLKDGSSIQAVPDNNVIIAHAPPEILATIKTIIKELDVKPDQVLVEAVIVKISQSLANDIGIQWGQIQESTDSDGTVTGKFTTGSTQFGTNGNGKSFGLIQGTSLAVVLHALIKNSATDILSTPTIVVLNNQKASISNGENIGIQNRTYALNNSGQSPQDQNPENGVFQTIQRKDITLSINVTPRISPNNMLQLKIKEKDDSLDADSADPLNPNISTSKINTRVLVRSGDILVLGGLIDNQQTKGDIKIPFLGSIPLLGRFFTYKNNTIKKTNLMVFIRPIILRDNVSNFRQTNHRYQYIRTQQMKAIAGQETSTDLPLLPNIPRKNKLRLPVPATTILKH